MKNFYEATVIKRALMLDVIVTLQPVGSCTCCVYINDNAVFGGIVTELTELFVSVPLTAGIDFRIQMQRSHPEAIILGISIDGIEIIPVYLHLATPPTNYLDFNGEWSMSIPSFYPWLHEITGQGWIT